jgi:hypothetical protein
MAAWLAETPGKGTNFIVVHMLVPLLHTFYSFGYLASKGLRNEKLHDLYRSTNIRMKKTVG